MNGLSTSAPDRLVTASAIPSARRLYWLPLGLFLLLVAAVGFQCLPDHMAPVVNRAAALADYFPPRIFGWVGEDRPLAETEAAQGKVQQILNYDDAIMRVYRRDGQEFSLYVAYWRPGKMSSREIAFHIPDKCWPTAGWTRVAANYAYSPGLSGPRLAPGQYREFTSPGKKEHVVYWHIFNGQVVIYNPDGSPSNLSMLTDLLQRGLRQKGEQYFIRLSSPVSLESLWRDDGFQEILELIAPLGPGLTANAVRFETLK